MGYPHLASEPRSCHMPNGVVTLEIKQYYLLINELLLSIYAQSDLCLRTSRKKFK